MNSRIAALIVGGVCLGAVAQDTQYECMSPSCDDVRVIPKQRNVICVITITYQQSRPKAQDMRIKGDGCEGTLVLAVERALDVSKRAAVFEGQVVPHYPNQDDVYKYRFP